MVCLVRVVDGAGAGRVASVPSGGRLAGRAAGVHASGDALVELLVVAPALGTLRLAAPRLLVPGAVRILQCHALTAGEDLVGVAAVQPQRLHLAVGHDDQAAVRHAAVARPHHPHVADPDVRREHLHLLDHHRTHTVHSVR